MGICEPCVGSAHAVSGQREQKYKVSSTSTAEASCWVPSGGGVLPPYQRRGGGMPPCQRHQRSLGVPLVLFLMILQPILLLLMPLVHAQNASPIAEVIKNTAIQTENCSKKKLWPPKETLGNKTILVGFLPYQTDVVSRPGANTVEKLGIKIPGAFSWAVDYVNNNLILPEGYKMQFEVYDTKGSEVISTKHVTDLLCRNASAIFGPENTCHVEGTIAAAYNRVMMSYACSNDILKNKKKYKTFARTNPSELSIISATIEVLKQNNWYKFSILYDEKQITVMEQLVAAAKIWNMTINHKELYNRENVTVFLQNSKASTRIYVYVGHLLHVNELLISMAMSGIYLPASKGINKAQKYMLIYMDNEEYEPKNWRQYIWHSTAMYYNTVDKSCMEYDLTTYYRGFMIVANRFPDEGDLKELAKNVHDYNNKEPFCLGKQADITRIGRRNPIGHQKHMPYLSAAYLYDSVIQYAKVVREIYNEMVNKSVIDVASNGSFIVDKLKNRTYKSILGYKMTLDQDVQSEGKYSVYLLDECTPALKKMWNETCSKCLVKIGDYEPEEDIKLSLEVDLKHILDEPECGYDGCETVGYGKLRKYVSYILAVCLVLFLFTSIILYRNWRYEQEIVGLQWRIDPRELSHTNSGFSGSRHSLASAASYDLHHPWYKERAVFKGTHVCLKKISIENMRSELTREIMTEFKNMRDTKHDNICSFIGAYTDNGSVTLITEYCSRGSLMDILAMDEIKINEMFIGSLVHDLIKALSFLHSNLGCHGNLKSSNCTVTSRWVLQLTDYGLHDLRKTVNTQLENDDRNCYFKNQLWRPPELLREGHEASGTKEGDIYAFGIILHEIIGRQGPFSTDHNDSYSSEEIVNKVRNGKDSTGMLFRPEILDLSNMPFSENEKVRDAMRDSWSENPKDRPDIRSLRSRLKCMREGKEGGRKGNLMDHMVHMLEEYSKNLEELVCNKTNQLMDEKKKTDDLLHRMLPPKVASFLTKGITVEPQSFESVTIYFSDIVGFTALSSESTPLEVVNFLNDLYTLFDNIIRGYDVYKVETIGDAYMVVSGLPTRNEGRHAGAISSMALELLDEVITNFTIRHRPKQKLKLRIGLHTGPVIAGVVGITMPRYCLFGDTVNTASRMESNGEALRIHISSQCNKALQALGGYNTEERGEVEMKGKGKVLTYWLISADEDAIQRKEPDTEIKGLFIRPEESTNLRRRSPMPFNRSIDDYKGGIAMIGRDISPSPRDSPRSDISSHMRRRLSNTYRNSVDSTTRGSTLYPPIVEPESCVRETESCENIHLDVPFIKTAVSTPASSEPTLLIDSVIDETYHVNFSPLSTEGHELHSGFGINEGDPMLNGDHNEDCSSDYGDTTNRTNSVKSWIAGIISKPNGRTRNNINNAIINGKESVV